MTPTISLETSNQRFGRALASALTDPLLILQGSSALWEAVADKAKMHRGQWIPVRVPGMKERRSFQNTVGRIRNGAINAFSQGRWEATRIADVIYVKYVGHDAASQPPAARAVGTPQSALVDVEGLARHLAAAISSYFEGQR